MNELQETTGMPYKLDLYDEYIRWYTMPQQAKKESGIVTQQNFIEHYELGKNTPIEHKIDASSHSTVAVMSPQVTHFQLTDPL